MSEIKVNKLSPRSGTTVTIGDSGDTINIVGTLQNNGSAIPGDISSVVAGTGLSGGGTSGDVTLNIEAAQPTITSLGTITSFRSIGIDDNADATAITINSSESVGINNTTMASFDADARNLVVGSGSGDNGLTIYSDGSSSGSIFFSNGTSGTQTKQGQIVYEQNNSAMIFSTGASERMRIDSSGNLFVNNTSEPSGGDNGAMISATLYHTFCRNNSGSAVLRAFGSAGEFRAIGNGNVQNTNNSYGAISDRVLKENEVDASSQWNDIKALQIKHYNFKLKPNEKQLGVIAQDLEASGMNGLVENNQDELYTEDDVLPEGKNIGDVRLKNYKSVKYSILYMKSVKALQEAMERIETLEAKVTALENN